MAGRQSRKSYECWRIFSGVESEDAVSADGFVLALVFALCGAGALLGIFVPERRNPALVAWAGSLASLLALWVSGHVLGSGAILHGSLWTIRSLGTLTFSLDRLSALFLLARV